MSRGGLWALAALVAIGIGVRLSVATFHGFFGDVQDWVDWGNLVDHDFLHPYSTGLRNTALNPTGRVPAYGPLAIWTFGLVVRAYTWFAGAGANLDVDHSPVLAALMKVPSTLGDLVVSATVFAVAVGRRGHWWAIALAALWLLSPVALVDGAAWGQLDVVPIAFVILAIWLAYRRNPALAGLMLGLSLPWKPQAAIFVPLIAAWELRWMGSRAVMKLLGTAAAVVVACCLPYVGGEMGSYIAIVTGVVSRQVTSQNAWNLWWLLGLAGRDPGTTLAAGLSISTVGWLLFLACMLLSLIFVMFRRSLEELLLAASLVAVAFFAVAPLQHERYMFQALPLLLLASVFSGRWLVLYLVASAATLANIAFVALPFVRPGETVGLWPLHVDYPPLLSWQVAVVVMAMLALLLYICARRLAFGGGAASGAGRLVR